jgi:hypothetical protein
MKIYEAATQVLRNTGRPMTAKEIYDAIVKDQLFTFSASEPVSVVNQTLRKKCEVPTNKGTVLFKRIGPSTFALIS